MNIKELKKRIQGKFDFVDATPYEEDCRKLGIDDNAIHSAVYVSTEADNPYSRQFKLKVELHQMHQLDRYDFASSAIKYVIKRRPNFKGIVFDANCRTMEQATEAMQIYANHFGLPIASYLNGKLIELEPQKKDCKKNNSVPPTILKKDTQNT